MHTGDIYDIFEGQEGCLSSEDDLAKPVEGRKIVGARSWREALAGRSFALGLVGGPPSAIDGDTLEVSGERVRLAGIDAPEAHQTCCDAGGERWRCGAEATAEMRRLSAGGVRCEASGHDRYERVIATRYGAFARRLASVVAEEGLEPPTQGL